MRRCIFRYLGAGCIGALAGFNAYAHFQVLIPSQDVVSDPHRNTVTLTLRFTHPMEGGPAMNMALPAQFGVLAGGKKENLLASLKSAPIDGKNAYTSGYAVKGPGIHIFFVEPKPYWEPEEDKYIKQYTKVVVGAFGLWQGWDAAVGFPAEIKPLSRPIGLWTGNLFRAVLMVNGRPSPNVTVEVEYYNEPRQITPPNGAFVTQEVKTDAAGIFAYAIPRAGWWGFAALTDAAETLPGPDGKPAAVESGAVMWVRAEDMK